MLTPPNRKPNFKLIFFIKFLTRVRNLTERLLAARVHWFCTKIGPTVQITLNWWFRLFLFIDQVLKYLFKELCLIKMGQTNLISIGVRDIFNIFFKTTRTLEDTTVKLKVQTETDAIFKNCYQKEEHQKCWSCNFFFYLPKTETHSVFFFCPRYISFCVFQS